MLHYNAENVGRWEDRADWVPFLEPGVDDPFVISEGGSSWSFVCVYGCGCVWGLVGGGDLNKIESDV